MTLSDKEWEELRAKKFKIAKTIIEEKRADIAKACGKQLDPDKLIRVSLTCLAEPTAGETLIRSTPESIAKAVLNFGQLAIYPDPTLAYGYFVDYAGEAKASIGYKGLIHLAVRTGAATSIDSQCVYQFADRERDGIITKEELKGDRFDVTLGTSPSIIHVPQFPDKREDDDKAPITWVYAIAHLKAGPPKIEVMSRAQVDNIRKASKLKTGGPWRFYFSQMARKTCIRRLANYLDLSQEIMEIIADDVASEYGGSDPAIDDYVQTGVDDSEFVDEGDYTTKAEELARRAEEWAGRDE